MPATILKTPNGNLKIAKTFTGGLQRITISKQVVYEGKLVAGEGQMLHMGDLMFLLEPLGKVAGGKPSAYKLEIVSNGEVTFSQMFDAFGGEIDSLKDGKKNAVIQICGGVGAVIGVVVMLTLNAVTEGEVPGGMVGGAIGGGVGGGMGYGIGWGINKMLGSGEEE